MGQAGKRLRVEFCQPEIRLIYGKGIHMISERTLNYAHRGFKSKYPENTMLAFRKAVEEGADGIEFDVHLTKDGELVIIHDERLDRTCQAQGRVKDYTLEELKKINAAKLFPEVGFEGIPTLEEYFKYIKDKDIITNIELKTGIFWYRGIEEKVYDLLSKYDLNDRILVSSFNHESLMKMKELGPELKFGALVSSWLDRPEDYLEKMGVDFYHPAAYCASPELVKRLHNCGIGINVWFGKEEYDFKTLVEMGVDGIISDFPDQVKELIRPL